MEKATLENIELGNLLFGNSRGAYAVVPREDYQELFVDFLEKNGFDMYGHRNDQQEDRFENEVFIVRPYYWGEDEEIAALPNFVYKPTDLEIKWYKYPMRDAYCNQDVSAEDFGAILQKCSESLAG